MSYRPRALVSYKVGQVGCHKADQTRDFPNPKAEVFEEKTSSVWSNGL